MTCAGCSEDIPVGQSVSLNRTVYCQCCALYQSALVLGPMLDSRWTPTVGHARSRSEALEVLRYMLPRLDALVRENCG